MGNRLGDVDKVMRALRRRHPLLHAWLDALNRLDGPSCRMAAARHASAERRPLMQTVERRRTGRRDYLHLVIGQPAPALQTRKREFLITVDPSDDEIPAPPCE
jgi:hypothetical protein